jgi:hypothetical protein
MLTSVNLPTITHMLIPKVFTINNREVFDMANYRKVADELSAIASKAKTELFTRKSVNDVT